MIRICHVTSVHPKEDVRIFHKECVSLVKAGYDVYLVQRGTSYEKHGVHIVGFGDVHSGRINRILCTAGMVYKKALEVNADVYHLHDPELLPYGLKLKKNGKKVIFDSHEFYAEQIKYKQYIPAFCRGFLAKVYAGYEKFILNRLDGLIFPCLVKGENPFAGCCAHMEMVNNVPMLDELYHHYDAAIPKYERSVCHVGSLTYNRGVTHLVKAAGAANCNVYLGGAFESAEYEQQIRNLPEFSNVQYLGVLNRQQVMETLQHSQVGVATLLNVGQYCHVWNLSTKVYEHMALAIPTVLSNTPYNQYVVEKYQIGICVDPSNVDEIASAICYLMDNPEEAKLMGENGRRAIKEEFNWGVEEKKLLAFYEDILKS